MRLPVLWCLLAATAWATSSDLLQQLISAPPDAIPALLQAHRADISPDLVENLVRQAVAESDAGHAPQAARLARLADDAEQLRTLRYEGAGQNALALNLMQQHRYAEATTVEADLTTRHPELFRPHFLLGTCYYEAGQLPAAVTQLETAARLDASNEETHLELAYAYVRQNRADDARQQFQAVLDINPLDGRAHDALVLLQAQATPVSANPQACSHFQQAEDDFRQQQFEQAISEYQAALQADPHLSKAAVYMGDAYLQLGSTDQAMAAYRQAIAINPADREAHRFLGDVFEKRYNQTHDRHDLDQAIEEYHHAVEADPNYQTARDDLQRTLLLRDGAP